METFKVKKVLAFPEKSGQKPEKNRMNFKNKNDDLDHVLDLFEEQQSSFNRSKSADQSITSEKDDENEYVSFAYKNDNDATFQKILAPLYGKQLQKPTKISEK